jgi:hypothetical protein
MDRKELDKLGAGYTSMKAIPVLSFFVVITWWVPWDLLLVFFAASQLFSNTGILLLFFLRSIRLLKDASGWLYHFFGAWLVWLLVMDIYLLRCCKIISSAPLFVLLITNLLLGSIVWIDIFRQKKQKIYIHGGRVKSKS